MTLYQAFQYITPESNSSKHRLAIRFSKQPLTHIKPFESKQNKQTSSSENEQKEDKDEMQVDEKPEAPNQKLKDNEDQTESTVSVRIFFFFKKLIN